MNIIILTELDQIEPQTYRLDDFRADHIRNVLKPETGDSLKIGILNGPKGMGTVVSITDQAVVLKVTDLVDVTANTTNIDLICALPRPQTLKKVLLISAMMNVRSLHLVRANRVEKSYYHSPVLKPENQYGHLIEGLSQGGHTRLPEVYIHDRFRVFFEDYLQQLTIDGEHPVRLIPDPEAETTMSGLTKGSSAVQLAIGPEGGWVPFEVELMQNIGFVPVILSRSILRVEYAVTAVLAQLELELS